MAEIRLPLSIVYETKGTTPVSQVIESLEATDVLVRDAVALLPSFIDGLKIDGSTLNVRSLTQESPLRESFMVAILTTFQSDASKEVPKVLEDLFGISGTEKYASLLTVVFLTVTFYGAAMACDMAKKTFSKSLPREKLEELITVLASETGKSRESIQRVLEAHFSKPPAMRRLIAKAKRVFIPSKIDLNAPVIVDNDRLETELVREIPYAGTPEKVVDFNKYTPYSKITLELHAQDRDKSKTGWAAIAPEIGDKRLKVRVMDPVQPAELWGRDKLVADVVVVSKLTSNGYVPSEIQLTRVISSTLSPHFRR